MKTQKKRGGPCPRGKACVGPVHREVRSHGARIKVIAERQAKVIENLDFILNKVSANGRPGLENSLKDIHGEIKTISTTLQSVLDATTTSRAWSDVRKSIARLAKASFLGAVLSNKFGRMVAIVAVLLVTNSILHAMGIGLDIQSILRFLRVIP